MRGIRPVWPVIDCGRSGRDVTDWEKEISSMQLALTEEESRSKYAKYYRRGAITPPLNNLKAAARGEMLELSETYRPEEFAKIINSPAREKIRTGYRVLPDGIGFAVVRVKAPGLTDEKMQFFIDHYRPEGDLFYKNWYPGIHMRHYSDMAIEDVGCGMEVIQFVKFISGEDLHIYDDMPSKDPDFIAISGGNGISSSLYHMGNAPRYAMSVRYTREISGGRETIMTFWQGLHWENGKSVRKIPENEAISEAELRGQCQHSIWEVETETKNVLEFWDDWHNGYFE